MDCVNSIGTRAVNVHPSKTSVHMKFKRRRDKNGVGRSNRGNIQLPPIKIDIYQTSRMTKYEYVYFRTKPPFVP